MIVDLGVVFVFVLYRLCSDCDRQMARTNIALGTACWPVFSCSSGELRFVTRSRNDFPAGWFSFNGRS